jgi:hypothetical protein
MSDLKQVTSYLTQVAHNRGELPGQANAAPAPAVLAQAQAQAPKPALAPSGIVVFRAGLNWITDTNKVDIPKNANLFISGKPIGKLEQFLKNTNPKTNELLKALTDETPVTYELPESGGRRRRKSRRNRSKRSRKSRKNRR